MRSTQRLPGRAGFTLVELLVAMALIIFIMALISAAFVAATGTFRDLKATAQLAENLRTTTTILRRYLSAYHFEGQKRLSDPNFWTAGPPQSCSLWRCANFRRSTASLSRCRSWKAAV